MAGVWGAKHCVFFYFVPFLCGVGFDLDGAVGILGGKEGAIWKLGELVMGWVLVPRACMAIEITFEPDNSSLSDGSSVVLPESEMPILQTRVLAWLIW